MRPPLDRNSDPKQRSIVQIADRLLPLAASACRMLMPRVAIYWKIGLPQLHTTWFRLPPSTSPTVDIESERGIALRSSGNGERHPFACLPLGISVERRSRGTDLDLASGCDRTVTPSMANYFHGSSEESVGENQLSNDSKTTKHGISSENAAAKSHHRFQNGFFEVGTPASNRF